MKLYFDGFDLDDRSLGITFRKKDVVIFFVMDHVLTGNEMPYHSIYKDGVAYITDIDEDTILGKIIAQYEYHTGRPVIFTWNLGKYDIKKVWTSKDRTRVIYKLLIYDDSKWCYIRFRRGEFIDSLRDLKALFTKNKSTK